ncbi:hypothetical protein BESB_083010 [Besnoitia besnoiti]|uniref:Uncharacterized protein n=1 Tax=Besnoitia besnoiti TaxID=94643 RepID=A0A2A9MCJ1_BESBE|nr:hypothetical protein BESB_083010 [Besnoitia besnoiti]PFH33102.1 hypothetical protein BESB_083010 [Besnoitia besnoiti]
MKRDDPPAACEGLCGSSRALPPPAAPPVSGAPPARNGLDSDKRGGDEARAAVVRALVEQVHLNGGFCAGAGLSGAKQELGNPSALSAPPPAPRVNGDRATAGLLSGLPNGASALRPHVGAATRSEAHAPASAAQLAAGGSSQGAEPAPGALVGASNASVVSAEGRSSSSEQEPSRLSVASAAARPPDRVPRLGSAASPPTAEEEASASSAHPAQNLPGSAPSSVPAASAGVASSSLPPFVFPLYPYVPPAHLLQPTRCQPALLPLSLLHSLSVPSLLAPPAAVGGAAQAPPGAAAALPRQSPRPPASSVAASAPSSSSPASQVSAVPSVAPPLNCASVAFPLLYPHLAAARRLPPLSSLPASAPANAPALRSQFSELLRHLPASSLASLAARAGKAAAPLVSGTARGPAAAALDGDKALLATSLPASLAAGASNKAVAAPGCSPLAAPPAEAAAARLPLAAAVPQSAALASSLASAVSAPAAAAGWYAARYGPGGGVCGAVCAYERNYKAVPTALKNLETFCAERRRRVRESFLQDRREVLKDTARMVQPFRVVKTIKIVEKRLKRIPVAPRTRGAPRALEAPGAASSGSPMTDEEAPKREEATTPEVGAEEKTARQQSAPSALRRPEDASSDVSAPPQHGNHSAAHDLPRGASPEADAAGEASPRVEADACPSISTSNEEKTEADADEAADDDEARRGAALPDEGAAEAPVAGAAEAHVSESDAEGARPRKRQVESVEEERGRGKRSRLGLEKEGGESEETHYVVEEERVSIVKLHSLKEVVAHLLPYHTYYVPDLEALASPAAEDEEEAAARRARILSLSRRVRDFTAWMKNPVAALPASPPQAPAVVSSACPPVEAATAAEDRQRGGDDPEQASGARSEPGKKPEPRVFHGGREIELMSYLSLRSAVDAVSLSIRATKVAIQNASSRPAPALQAPPSASSSAAAAAGGPGAGLPPVSGEGAGAPAWGGPAGATALGAPAPRLQPIGGEEACGWPCSPRSGLTSADDVSEDKSDLDSSRTRGRSSTVSSSLGPASVASSLAPASPGAYFYGLPSGAPQPKGERSARGSPGAPAGGRVPAAPGASFSSSASAVSNSSFASSPAGSSRLSATSGLPHAPRDRPGGGRIRLAVSAAAAAAVSAGGAQPHAAATAYGAPFLSGADSAPGGPSAAGGEARRHHRHHGSGREKKDKKSKRGRRGSHDGSSTRRETSSSHRGGEEAAAFGPRGPLGAPPYAPPHSALGSAYPPPGAAGFPASAGFNGGGRAEDAAGAVPRQGLFSSLHQGPAGTAGGAFPSAYPPQREGEGGGGRVRINIGNAELFARRG